MTPIQQMFLGTGGAEDFGPMDPHPGSWNYDINTLGFMGKAPYYRWRNICTDYICGYFLKPDGMAFYSFNEDGILRRHNMSTAYDIGTAYYSQKVSLNLSSATNGRGVVFKPDGTQFFYLDNNIIKSYTLSTAWDLYTASYNSSNTINVSSNLTNSNNSVSLNWKPDGTKVYVAEDNSGPPDYGTANYIHQWTLSSAWNLTTASYANKSPIFENSAATNSANFADYVKGFSFKPDGTVIYVTHNTNMRIGIWPLSTAWDVTTRGSRTGYPVYFQDIDTFDAKGLNIQWKSDGTKFYLTGGRSCNCIVQYEPSSAWNAGNNGYDDLPGDDSSYTDFHNNRPAQGYKLGSTYTGHYWHNNGTYLFTFGQNQVYRWTCSTPYDFKTAGSVIEYEGWGDTPSFQGGLEDFKMNLAGTRFLLANRQNGYVREFNLTTPFDIRDSNHIDTDDYTFSGSGIAFISHNGEHFYYKRGATLLQQYDLSSAFDVSTASFIRSVTLPVIFYNLIKMSPDGTKLYGFAGPTSDGNEIIIYEFTLSTPFDVSTISSSYKQRNYSDLSSYGPQVHQSLGANITNVGFNFAPYYRTFLINFRSCSFVSSGLIHHLDAGNSGSYSGSGTTWTDLSSSSNNGTLTNGPTYSSSGGGSIVLDGSNDSVRTNSEMFNPNANFTFSAWVNADTTTGTHTLISDRNGTGNFQLRIGASGGGNWQILDAWVVLVGTFSNSGPVATDYWYNITVTRSSNTYSLYINGRFNSSFTSSNSYDRGPKDIGTNYNTSELWDGKISQVMSYSRALSATEILQNFNHFKYRYGN